MALVLCQPQSTSVVHGKRAGLLFANLKIVVNLLWVVWLCLEKAASLSTAQPTKSNGLQNFKTFSSGHKSLSTNNVCKQ